MAEIYTVVKRNKKLHIASTVTGDIIYTPPDFLRIDNRAQLQELADQLDEGIEPISAVVAFESMRKTRNAARP